MNNVPASSLGTEIMTLTSSGDYPSMGETITLTCTITTDNPTPGYPWSLEIHRPGGAGSDISDNSAGSIKPDCINSTSAQYNVNQCDLKDEETTLVFGITDITEKEIGQWGCYYSYGQEPKAMLAVDKLGKYNIAFTLHVLYILDIII